MTIEAKAEEFLDVVGDLETLTVDGAVPAPTLAGIEAALRRLDDVVAAADGAAVAQAAAALSELDRLEAIWRSPTADVARHGGESVVANTDAKLAAMDAAADRGDWTGMAGEGKACLELVDSMEQVYG